MRILFTNDRLAKHNAAQVYLRDVATALFERGHTPICFSKTFGAVEAELRAAMIPVVEDLRALAAAPDVIHGQHHIETMVALLMFPNVPAVHMCHEWLPAPHAPPRFPRIRRYLATSRACRELLVTEHGVPEDRVRTLLDFVDLTRLNHRRPLPQYPSRALVACGESGVTAHLRVVEEACARMGLALDVDGAGPRARPSPLHGVSSRYDLVFACGHTALEAMAVGAAVVLCNAEGLGPLVTSADLDRLRAENFGMRTLRGPLEPDSVVREITRYDAADATEVSRRIRASAGRDTAVGELVTIYHDAVEQQAASFSDASIEVEAIADYLRWLGPLVESSARRELFERAARAEAECQALQTRVQRLQGDAATQRLDRERLEAEHDRTKTLCAELEAERVRLRVELQRLTSELGAVCGTATFRLRERVLRSAVLGTPTRLIARVTKGRLYR
jgi:hypothetical protein